jgi:hypothetical protein
LEPLRKLPSRYKVFRASPRRRSLWALGFHHPETLHDWLKAASSLRARLPEMPDLVTDGLVIARWPRSRGSKPCCVEISDAPSCRWLQGRAKRSPPTLASSSRSPRREP